MKKLSQIKCVIMDLDGTIYLGNNLFPWTTTFLKFLKRKSIIPVFMTNNSSLSPTDYQKKFSSIGLPHIPLQNIYTSSDATIQYLKHYTTVQRIYLLGTPSVKCFFRENNIKVTSKDAQAVIFAYDKTLTYNKLNIAFRLISQKKLPFLCTHPDITCPASDGFVDIDTGAMMYAIIKATGKKPLILGKPNPIMIEGIIKRFNLRKENLLVVGDRLETDIMLGKNAGVLSCLVLTGVTTCQQVKKSKIVPDIIVKTLDKLIEYF